MSDQRRTIQLDFNEWGAVLRQNFESMAMFVTNVCSPGHPMYASLDARTVKGAHEHLDRMKEMVTAWGAAQIAQQNPPQELSRAAAPSSISTSGATKPAPDEPRMRKKPGPKPKNKIP